MGHRLDPQGVPPLDGAGAWSGRRSRSCAGPLGRRGDVGTDTAYCGFKTYEEGRLAWQGPTLDGVWFDEEPPLDIYSEGLTRTQAQGLFAMITFTPLLGMSEVVASFLLETRAESSCAT